LTRAHERFAWWQVVMTNSALTGGNYGLRVVLS
jgi:hypothetical protein